MENPANSKRAWESTPSQALRVTRLAGGTEGSGPHDGHSLAEPSPLPVREGEHPTRDVCGFPRAGQALALVTW